MIIDTVMAKTIGDSDCTGIIKHNLLKYGIKGIYSIDDIRELEEFYEEIIEKKEKDRQHKLNLIEKEIIKDLLMKKYFGAIGEEKVINTLKLLPDTYYILNEIRIRLTKSVLWKKYFEYVKSAQIDHIVVGETGIFLIETKNWKDMNLTSVHNSPHKQIDRAGMLFWIAQNRKFGTPYKSYNLVVTIKDLTKYKYKYVYQLPVKELNRFILSKKSQLTKRQIEQIKNWLINLRVINPRPPFYRFC